MEEVVTECIPAREVPEILTMSSFCQNLLVLLWQLYLPELGQQRRGRAHGGRSVHTVYYQPSGNILISAGSHCTKVPMSNPYEQLATQAVRCHVVSPSQPHNTFVHSFFCRSNLYPDTSMFYTYYLYSSQHKKKTYEI